MKVIEKRNYQILKYIAIGLLLVIDLFVLYLLILMFNKQFQGLSDLMEYIFTFYIFITIPIFLVVSFPKIEFTNSLIKIKYLGLIKYQSQISELRIYLTNNSDRLEIKNSLGQKLVTIHQENTINFEDLLLFLDSRIQRGQSTFSKVKWSHFVWLGIGLVLYTIYWLIN